MNKKKKLVIVLLLLVALVGTIVYITRLKNHETVEQPKVAETAKENKTDKKTDTKTDDKTDKKNDTKPSDKKEDVKTDDKKSDTKTDVTETSTSTENTTSTTSVAPKNTETTTSNKTDNVPAPCVPTYTTVNHPEQGHYETRVVKEAEYVPVYDRKIVGGQTGRIYNSLDEWGAQDEDYSYSVKTVQVGTEYHEAVTEQVWVVDQPAYTTTETSGC